MDVFGYLYYPRKDVAFPIKEPVITIGPEPGHHIRIRADIDVVAELAADSTNSGYYRLSIRSGNHPVLVNDVAVSGQVALRDCDRIKITTSPGPDFIFKVKQTNRLEPTLGSPVDVVRTPKSALRTPRLAGSTTPKSVKFNRMVEENRCQYDQRTGLLCSSKKFTRELATLPSDQQQPVEESDGLQKVLPHSTPVAQMNLGGPKTLQQKGIPLADYQTNVDFGLKQLMNPNSSPEADYQSNVDFGVKRLQEPGTPRADYQTNVDFGLKQLMNPNSSPEADYQSNIDFGVKRLQEPGTPRADYEINVDFGLKQLMNPNRNPKADYQSNVDFGVKRLQEPGTPLADYETNVDFGVKRLQQAGTPRADYRRNVWLVRWMNQPGTPDADYEANVSGIDRLFDQGETEGSGFTTPVKKPRRAGRKLSPGAEKTRRVTRSARKAIQDAADSTGAKLAGGTRKTSRRKTAKVVEDEIGEFMGDLGEGSTSKPHLDFDQLTKMDTGNESCEVAWCGDSDSRGCVYKENQLDQILDLEEDEQSLLDAMEKEPVRRPPTRKRKAQVQPSDVKSRAAKNRTAGQEPGGKENQLNKANVDPHHIRVLLPPDGAFLPQFVPRGEPIMTRSRARRQHNF